MSGFTCPFCGNTMSLDSGTQAVYGINFNNVGKPYHLSNPYLHITIYRCPNDNCKKETIIAKGIDGYIENRTVNIYPEAIYSHFPDYVPASIRADYEEACMIANKSPKAAATLARRCLQGMIRDFWGITGKKNLFEEIDAIKDKIPPAQWKAIDAIRKIGNIGAHMEQDVNLIVELTTDEADQLIRLIELLIDKWYVAKHDEEELYAEAVKILKSKDKARSQETPNQPLQDALHQESSTP